MHSSPVGTAALLTAVAHLCVATSCAHSSGKDETPRTQPERSRPAPKTRVIERNAGESSATETTDEETSRERADLTVSQLESRARERELGGGDYPYHDEPRQVSGKIDCPEIETIEYDGSVIDYNQSIEINRRFKKRLVRFEKIVRDVAEAVYGRPPDRIVHYGGHNCRTIGGDGEKLSEHSFGHAIDVVGFDFDAVERSEKRAMDLGRAARSFEVRLGKHWNASTGFASSHSEFLHRLVEELEWRGPFSTMLGPGYPGHDEIFHFDFGPEFFFRLR